MNGQPGIRGAELPRLLEAAMAQHRAGQLQEAETLYEAILRAAPRDFAALNCLGIARCQRGRHKEGIAAFKSALELQPDSAETQVNLGRAYKELGQYGKALGRYERALALQPANVPALNDRGVVLAALERHEEAVASYERALALEPNYAEAIYNRGRALVALRRLEEALGCFNQALALRPDLPQALHNRANVLSDLHRYEEAASDYVRLLAQQPGFTEALPNFAAALVKLNRLEEALAAYRAALKADPRNADALQGCAAVFVRLSRRDEARQCIGQLLRIDPDRSCIAGWHLHESMACCHWERYEEQVRAITRGVRSGRHCVGPLTFLYLSDSAADQRLCAERETRALLQPTRPPQLWTGQIYDHERIRVAYLSADFNNHATANLIAGLFEHHDRSRFETIGVSFGPEYRDDMRLRLERGLERFVDVTRLSDIQAAQLLRDMEVDIIVDLKGYTMDSRAGILARRPGPIQVSYLGFPGTLGAPFIDYLLADRTVIPEADDGHYSEQIVYLPDSYQVNDDKRPVAAATPSRAEAGLPQDGFVFCAFNASYKITPALFDVWMRLLQAVDGSVLWLIAGEEATIGNLRREARARGVDADRLVFARRVALEDHLARHRLADLFLDTLPYNAHTTASDALWAGLPVLTCLGSTFAGRVGASLLRAVGLPELVTDSLPAYERLALDLARDPARLGDLRAGLAAGLNTAPLFDTARFCRNIERAYEMMYARHRRGERPATFAVDATPV